ncbi:hypothetical protein K7432_010456, partial [Basidiobolus ranarum]
LITGDIDVLGYMLAAVGAIGDLVDLYRLDKSFKEIGITARGLKKGTTVKWFQHLNANDIKLKADRCMR